MGHNHRLVWLTSLARFIGYPAFVLTAALRLVDVHPGSILLCGLYVIVIPIFWGFRNTVRDASRARTANRLGARIVPRVKGKWPGNIDLMIKLVGSLESGYVAEGKQLTPPRRLITPFIVVTIDHDVIKYMLATGFNAFGKGPIQQARLESFLGDGIFNRDGELWKFHRNMTRPFFVRERISEFEVFDSYTQKMIARIDEAPIDVQDLFGRLTIDAAGEFLFSCTTLDTLSLPLPTAYHAEIGPRGTAAPTSYGAFVSAFDEVQTIIPVRGRMGPYIWPVVEWKGDRVWKFRCVIDEWVKPLIDSAVQRREGYLKGGGNKDEPAGDTFIDDLVKSTDDRTLITDELVNILLAARDTTTTLLTFATYLMTQHPQVLGRLREEIMTHVGPDAAPTYDQLKGMKYLRAILNETLRLFPPVPINERAAVSACTIPTSFGKYYVPPGTRIMYSPLLMQRRRDLWGTDAWDFDPERWLDARHEGYLKDPMRFVPFNAGPRICLGQQFAYNQASFVLVRVFQKYSALELAMDAAPAGSLPPVEWRGQDGRKGFERVWPKNAITLYAKGGMWVRLIR
ncbi:unnamed protein product [Rhizoctonia solani]|uniref:Uncharacterized protein n=1 Tax=Rhizoctonia solani TaxID=456999 RepID=A0A8H3DV40_9AGAM|nr:unnamed protein product [Rhizoctonia solani]